MEMRSPDGSCFSLYNLLKNSLTYSVIIKVNMSFLDANFNLHLLEDSRSRTRCLSDNVLKLVTELFYQ